MGGGGVSRRRVFGLVSGARVDITKRVMHIYDFFEFIFKNVTILFLSAGLMLYSFQVLDGASQNRDLRARI